MPQSRTPRLWSPIAWSVSLHGALLLALGLAASGWMERFTPQAGGGSENASFGEIQIVNVAPLIPARAVLPPKDSVLPIAKGTGVGAGVGSGAGISDGSRQATYLERLHALIESKKSYPLRAKRLGMSGRVLLRFFVMPDGILDRIEVESSSGHDLLDEAARQAVQRVAQFEAFPEDWDARELELSLPIQFSLQ